MAKTCPHCGYRPIEPSHDNCPMCDEPVHTVRGRAAGSAGRTNLLWWVLGGTFVAARSGGGCCGIWRLGKSIRDARNEVEREQVDVEADRRARTVVVTAAQLLHEFQKDREAADRKYTDKYLEISGVVE